MTGATISSNTQAGWVSTDEIPSTTCLGQEIETSWQGGVWNLENRDHSSEFVESKSCAERYWGGSWIDMVPPSVIALEGRYRYAYKMTRTHEKVRNSPKSKGG